MRRYELVTVVTDGHRIEGPRGVVLAFFGKIIAFLAIKGQFCSFSRASQMVTAVTDGPRWSQVVTVGHRIGEGWVRPLIQPPSTPPTQTGTSSARPLLRVAGACWLCANTTPTPHQHHIDTAPSHTRCCSHDLARPKSEDPVRQPCQDAIPSGIRNFD